MKKIKQVNDFQIKIEDEDHTIMNILKTCIANNWVEGPEVDFCGYTIPHPSENVALLSVQFKKEEKQNFTQIKKTVKSSCDVINKICDRILEQLDQ